MIADVSSGSEAVAGVASIGSAFPSKANISSDADADLAERQADVRFCIFADQTAMSAYCQSGIRYIGQIPSTTPHSKAYEADMCHLIDTYIEAAEPRVISPFENIGLLDLIVNTGIAGAINRRTAAQAWLSRWYLVIQALPPATP